MLCSVCAAPAAPGSSFCPRCGSPLASPAAPGPGPAPSARPGGHEGGGEYPGNPNPGGGYHGTWPPGAGFPGGGPPRRPAQRRAWPWIAAAAVAVLLIGGGITAFLLLRSPDPADVVRELEERRAEAWARQDVDLLRDYYADAEVADDEAEGFFDGARVRVLDIEIVSADDDRIVARVRTLEPGFDNDPPEEVTVEQTYEFRGVGDGDEEWRATDWTVVD